jgi:hypothetical protein
MLPTRHLIEFLLTVYVLILVPGPSVRFVVSRGVALGRRAAPATVVGNATARADDRRGRSRLIALGLRLALTGRRS